MKSTRKATVLGMSLALAGRVATAQTTAPDGASVGTVHAGHIAGAATELPARGPGFHWQTNKGNPDAHYGTPSLVAAVERGAAAIAAAHPGSELAVLDMALPHGGPIPHHASHTSGRDVDIAYYAMDAATGDAVRLSRPVAYDARGEATDPDTGRAIRLDVARTWELMAGFLADPTIAVERMFIAPPLRTLVLAYARAHASRSLAARAVAVLRPPGNPRADPHADHFHLRIACPSGDVAWGCR